MNTIETISELLRRKADLAEEMGGNCPPSRRDEIEQEIKQIDETLNSLDPAKATPASGIPGGSN